jgi:Domain of unknown function (DUF4440)
VGLNVARGGCAGDGAVARKGLRVVLCSALASEFETGAPAQLSIAGVLMLMKTVAITMLLLTTCCWGVSVCAQAPDSSSEAELRATMAECRKAALEGDLEKITGCLADQYLQTDIAGYVQDKTAWLNEYARPLADLIKAGKFRWEVYDPKDVQIRMYGDAAVVIGSLELKGSGARPTPQHTWVADPDAHVSLTLRFTRVYIKRSGKWLLAALHNAVPLPPAK